MTPIPQPETRRVYSCGPTTPTDYLSTSHTEAAHLIDIGFAGELLSESPFKMLFPADARPAAERRRRRIAAARLKDRDNAREAGTGGTR